MSTYNITNVYNPSSYSVDSDFTRYMDNLFMSNLRNGRLAICNLGSNEDKILLNNASVIDIGKCVGLVDQNKDLYTDLTDERYKIHGGDVNTEPLTDVMRRVLFADYLLKSYICYVEVFKGTMPVKFYATRNIELLEYMSRIDVNDPNIGGYALPFEKDLTKARTLCAPLTLAKIKDGALRFVKIEYKKKGISVVEPKSETYVGSSSIRITPVYFNANIAHYLWQRLNNEVLEITYMKDNMVKRSVTATLNVDYLRKVYENNYNKVHDVLSYANCTKINRGYITVPELLLPLSDETGCRAVSFRICGIKSVDITTFSNPFLHINLEGVPAQFEYYLEMYRNTKPVLEQIKYLIELSSGALVGTADEAKKLEVFGQIQQMSAQELISSMLDWLNTCMLIDKTQILRKVHLLMINNPIIFARYTGRRIETSTGIDWTAGI